MTCNILLVYTHPTRNLQKLAFHHQNAKLAHHQRQFNPHETNINNILCHQIDARLREPGHGYNCIDYENVHHLNIKSPCGFGIT